MKMIYFKIILWGIIIFKQCTKEFIVENLAMWIYDLFFCIIYFVVLCIALKKEGIKKNLLCALYFPYAICMPIFYIVYNLCDDSYSMVKVAQYEYEFMCISGVFAGVFLIAAILKMFFLVQNAIRKRLSD